MHSWPEDERPRGRSAGSPRGLPGLLPRPRAAPRKGRRSQRRPATAAPNRPEYLVEIKAQYPELRVLFDSTSEIKSWGNSGLVQKWIERDGLPLCRPRIFGIEGLGDFETEGTGGGGSLWRGDRQYCKCAVPQDVAARFYPRRSRHSRGGTFGRFFRRFQIRADNRELLWKGWSFNSLLGDDFLFMRNYLQHEFLKTLEWIHTISCEIS